MAGVGGRAHGRARRRGRGRRHADGGQRHEDGDRRHRALRRRGHRAGGRWRSAAASRAGQIVATIAPRARPTDGPAAHLRRGHLGADAGRGDGAAGHRPRPLRARLDRPRRRAPAQPRQAHLPRAHRPAARSRQLPRGRQPRRLRQLRRRGPHRRLHARQPRRRLGQDRRPHRPWSAPTTSPRAAATPTARSAARAAISTGCRWSFSARRSACSTARPAAAASRRWCRASRPRARARAKESSGAITAGRPRVSGGGGSFLPGHLGSSMFAEQLADGAGGQRAARQRRRHRRGQGGARPLLGDGARHRPAVRRRTAGGRHAMGYDITKEDLGDWRIHCRNGSVDNLAETEEEAVAMTRRFLSYLPSRVYEAPPVWPRPTIRPTGARKSCSPSCRASAPPPSTCAAPSA